MEPWIEALTARLGPDAVLTGTEAEARGYSPWTRAGAPQAVVRPASTEAVSQALAFANARSLPVVPWGGLTGLVDGAVADGGIALALDRMNRVERVDREAATLTVQAGCVLETAVRAAADAGMLLPIDLGARGSATIGGCVATNAGGNRVLRYGMTREQVLGLEVVLADGTVLSSLGGLIKNNTGYDLKSLFVGSEGTLGVVTRATLRLRPLPASQDTALLAVDAFAKLPRLLRRLEARLGGALSAFEVMWAAFYDLVTTAPARGRPVLPPGTPYYVLVDSLGAEPEADARRMESALQEVLEAGLALDAVLAKSRAEGERLWALRDDVAQTARNGPVVTFDVSLPLAAMEAYVAGVEAALRARWPTATLVVFGHLGDGNLHLIVGGVDPAARAEVEATVYRPLQAVAGSISAEHGIGLAKRAWLPLSRTPEELAVMRALKAALDPRGVLNPGKVLAPA